MALTINIPDTLRQNVESASAGKLTVVYTQKQQPCFMHVVPKFSLNEIDPALPATVHPAFVVDGVEKSEVMVGQYLAHQLNDEAVSIPGVDPKADITIDNSVSLAQANGANWHVASNVEYAALQMWCWKNGFQPRGNTDEGRNHRIHEEYGVRHDGVTPGINTGSSRTLTGSGPTSWRHDNTPFGITDLCGNVWEWSPGMRIDGGEIQVIANNDAALGTADFSAASTQWRTISGATGEFGAPGDADAVKYANAASGTVDYTLYCAHDTPFADMQNSTGTNPVSAAALDTLKALGLFPVAAGLGSDHFYINTTGERVPLRGGNWSSGSRAGVFAFYLLRARSGSGPRIGFRPAFVA